MGLNLEPVPENPAKKKLQAYIVTGVACVLMLVTLFTNSWLGAGGGVEGGMGLRGYELCMRGDCIDGSNKGLIDEHNARVKEMKEMGYGGKAEEKSSIFWIAGYLTLAFGLLSVIALIASAVMVAKDKFVTRPMAPTSAAMLCLFLGLLGAVLFLVTNPTRGMAFQLGTGWGFFGFGAGSIAGIVAAQLLVKFKPADPDSMTF